MQAIIERCCGLDVHQETVVACLLTDAASARTHKKVRIFRTVRRELEALRDWLTAAGVTHVGMESTGVYWRPLPISSAASNASAITSPSNPGPKPRDRTRSADHFVADRLRMGDGVGCFPGMRAVE